MRYEKRTMTCFWYHFKKRVGTIDHLTFRTKELVAFFFKGVRSTLKKVDFDERSRDPGPSQLPVLTSSLLERLSQEFLNHIISFLFRTARDLLCRFGSFQNGEGRPFANGRHPGAATVCQRPTNGRWQTVAAPTASWGEDGPHLAMGRVPCDLHQL